MNKSRTRLIVMLAVTLCSVSSHSARGQGAEPAVNPVCARIQKNVSVRAVASKAGVNITLANQDTATLWLSETPDRYGHDPATKAQTLWHGYFPEAYPGYLRFHYSILPMRKVLPKQTSRWTITPSADGVVDALTPGQKIKVRMRAALKPFESKGRMLGDAGQKLLADLLAQSCILEASATVTSK